MQPDFPTSERWDRLATLFDQAIQQDPENLSDFLNETCGTDFELRTEVSSLLARSRYSTDVLREGAPGSTQNTTPRHSYPIKPGLVIDHYQVIRMVGSGGMGQVYLAQDLRLQRQVAESSASCHHARARSIPTFRSRSTSCLGAQSS